MTRVAVIGAGITGLTCALHLGDAGVETVVFEATERVGGKIHTIPLGREHIEEGADALLPRDDAPLRLLGRIGLAPELVSPDVFGAVVAWRGELHVLPEGTLMGVPTSSAALGAAAMLGSGGKLRARVGTALHRRLDGPDVSVARFVGSRYGRQVLDRMVDPVLAGTRAGDAAELGLAAAMKELDALARSGRRLLARKSTAGSARPPRFVAPRGGMAQLTNALARSLDSVEVRLATPLDAIDVTSTGIVAGDETFDGVVVTCGSHDAARLLQTTAPDAAEGLRTIEHARSIVLNVAFTPGAIEVPSYGSGLLVPRAEAAALTAATWFNRKWPHTKPSDGSDVVRCFIGRAAATDLIELDDAAIAERAIDDLGRFVRIAAPPRVLSVRRWHRGLAKYKVGHLDLVRAIERSLPARIRVAGTDLRGTGIPDCFAQAEWASRELMGRMRR